MGINVSGAIAASYAVSAVLAGIAALLIAPLFNVSAEMGTLFGIKAFAAAIIGGLGSIYGAILGGFLFAGLQTVGTVLLPFASAYKDVFAFAVVIAIMAWRPTGLIRDKISERV
jgi:branched-chain amino acid transport system permease protein